jgi:hypothetical protein
MGSASMSARKPTMGLDPSAGLGGLLALDDGDHTGLADTGMHFVNAAQLERMHHAAGGVDLFKAEFGMGVQVAPEGGQFGVVLHDLREGPAGGAQLGRATGLSAVFAAAVGWRDEAPGRLGRVAGARMSVES